MYLFKESEMNNQEPISSEIMVHDVKSILAESRPTPVRTRATSLSVDKELLSSYIVALNKKQARSAKRLAAINRANAVDTAARNRPSSLPANVFSTRVSVGRRNAWTKKKVRFRERLASTILFNKVYFTSYCGCFYCKFCHSHKCRNCVIFLGVFLLATIIIIFIFLLSKLYADKESASSRF